jgi:hypothetical protein
MNDLPSIRVSIIFSELSEKATNTKSPDALHAIVVGHDLLY